MSDDLIEDEFDVNDSELDDFNEEVSHMEPADEPHPTELLPEFCELPIESQRLNKANVRLLMTAITTAIQHRYAHPVYGPVNEIDVLTALQNMIRVFAVNTVIARREYPTTATVNRVAILKMIEELNDEILKLDLPKPQVN